MEETSKTEKKLFYSGSCSNSKTTMTHSFGIPPSASWSGKYSAVVFEVDEKSSTNNAFNTNNKIKTLLYISNSFIPGINLLLNSFNQLVYSNNLIKDEKFTCLFNYKNLLLLAGTNKGKIIHFTYTIKSGSIFFKESYYKEVKVNSNPNPNEILCLPYYKALLILI